MSSTTPASSGTPTAAITLSSLSAQITQTHTLLAALFAIIIILLVFGLIYLFWTSCVKNREAGRTTADDDTERAIPLATMGAGRGIGLPADYELDTEHVDVVPPPATRSSRREYIETPVRFAPSVSDQQQQQQQQPYRSQSQYVPRSRPVPQSTQSHGADYTNGGRSGRYDDDGSHSRHDNTMGAGDGRNLDRINNA